MDNDTQSPLYQRPPQSLSDVQDIATRPGSFAAQPGSQYGDDAAQTDAATSAEWEQVQYAYQRSIAESQLLYEAGYLLGSTLNTDTIFDTLRHLVSRVMQYDSLLVSSFDVQTNTIFCSYAFIEGMRVDPGNFPIVAFSPQGTGMQSTVIRTGEPLLILNAQERAQRGNTRYYVDPNGTAHPEKDKAKPQTQSILMVPMKLEGHVLGVVQLQSVIKDAYSKEDLRILEALALQMAAASRNAFLYQQAQEEIAERKQAEQALRDSENKYRALVETTRDLIWSIDIWGNILFVNQAVYRTLGYTPEEVVGRSFTEFMLPERYRKNVSAYEQLLRGKAQIRYEAIFRHKEGSPRLLTINGVIVYDAQGNITGATGTATDVTQRRKAEELIRWQAFHDALTNLPNRTLFQDRVEQAIASAERHHKIAAVIFLDLDGFKHINDKLGHAVGDMLLQRIAARLSLCLRADDTLARMGGDEFTILLPGLTAVEDATLAAQRLLDCFQTPMLVEGHELFITASLGISFYPVDGRDTSTLLRYADMAMYRAKGQGRNRYHLYTSTMNAAASERLALENSLRKAIEREEFHLLYQPQIDLSSGLVTGVEALVRWQHPERGLVLPTTFIPLAEETGLIVPLGKWVLREACRQAALWQQAGQPLRMSVNVSARQFMEGELVKALKTTLREERMEPQWLQIELTESVLIQTGETVIEILQEIKDQGVLLSVDDFGTGYSSLGYLRHFPLDILKIDRSFVQDIALDVQGKAIVRAIIDLSHSLSLQVIAEGVETQEQRECLETMGCDKIQGFLFSPPVSAEALAVLLSNTAVCSPL